MNYKSGAINSYEVVSDLGKTHGSDIEIVD